MILLNYIILFFPYHELYHIIIIISSKLSLLLVVVIPTKLWTRSVLKMTDFLFPHLLSFDFIFLHHNNRTYWQTVSP